MPRPKKPRFVSKYPSLTAFVPQGVPAAGEVLLSIEELEAIRLSDVERRDQESAAHLMQVSRQTYGRILGNARGIVGEALITGKALRIEGGTFEMRGGQQYRRRRRANKAVAIDNIPGKGVETMPLRDGRWPQGQGARPGSRWRRCYAGRTTPALNRQDRMGSGPGSGQGRGQGVGRGFGKGGGKRR